MRDELVHVSSLLRETGLAVAALLGGAEIMREEWVVEGADYGEVVRHSDIEDRRALWMVREEC